MTFIFQLSIVAVLIVAGVVGFFWWRRRRNLSLRRKLQRKLLLVRFPKFETEEVDEVEEISKMENLFSTVSKFDEPIVFESSVSYLEDEIGFYVSVPSKHIDPLVRQIHSLWEEALVEEVGDYNIFNHGGHSLVAELSQKKDFALPVRTYRDLESDSFVSILGGLSGLKEVGEGGALQVVVKPATSRVTKQVKGKLKSLKRGGDLSGWDLMGFLSDLWDGLRGKLGVEEETESDQNLVKAVDGKYSKPLFEVNVRIAASGPDRHTAESIFDGMASGFSQFDAPDYNSLNVSNPTPSGEEIHKFSFREWDRKNSIVLNSEELASIFHFPTPSIDIPKIKSLKARELPPPPELPKDGLLLGENIYKGDKTPVYVQKEDRRRHIYMIGQTGTGKSNLMTSMINQDIKNGEGVGVVDPHGDLVEDILGLVPRERFDDVILFDPSDINRPLGLNMLEYDQDRPEEKTFIVNEMVEIFDKLYDLQKTGGPMFEQYMRNALLLLMEDFENEKATLMEVPRVFTDKEFRNKKIERISNPTVVNFWRDQAEEAGGEASLSNITPYITSKFNNFTANEYMRVIVGQAESSFNFRDVMDDGKILLVNLSKGKIGDLNANLLGMIAVGKLLMAALSRVDMSESKRRDFNLYIDEFQNFTTESISTILSEARKYRLSLVIAHQFVDQLEEDIKSSVFGNVGSTVSFRVGAPSAETLVNQFEPELTENDLVNIDNYHAYVKLLVNGETTSPFNMRTFKAESPDVDRGSQLKKYIRERQGTSREKVERRIQQRMSS